MNAAPSPTPQGAQIARHTKLGRIVVSGAEGVKDQRFDENLAGVDVWTGPNGAGKSTRLISVLAALRGLAETPTDNVRDYLGPGLPAATVDLHFEGAPRLSRDLSAKRSSSGGKRADGQAELLVGPHMVRWDLADLSSAADSERTKVLQRVCDAAAGGASVDQILAQLPQDNPEIDRLRALKEKEPSEWLKAALKLTRERFTETNAAQKAAQPPPPAADEEPPFGTLAEASAAVRTARTRLQDAVTAVKVRAGRVAEHDKLRAQLEDLGEVEPPEGTLSEAQDALKTVREELAAVERAVAVRKALVDEQAKLRRQLDETPAVARVDLAPIEERVRVATADLHGAQDLYRQIRSQIEALKPRIVDQVHTCRHCNGADPLGVQGDQPGLREQLATLEADLADVEREGRAASALVQAAQKKLTAAKETNLAAADQERARARLDELAAGLPPDRSAELPRLAQAVLAGELWVKRHEQAAARRRDEDRLASLAADLPADRAVEIPALEEELRAAEERHAAHIRLADREKAFQAALDKRNAAVATFEAVKAMGAALADIEKKLMAASFPLIADKANAVLGMADVPLHVVFRSGADFGAERADAGYVPWWSLSDGERAVVGAALSVAFAQLGGARWRAVFLDGLEAVDPARRDGLLHALVELVRRGELDNVLAGLWADSPPVLPAGVTVHWLGGTVASGASNAAGGAK